MTLALKVNMRAIVIVIKREKTEKTALADKMKSLETFM